ncbi:MAG: SurA N-terminal domain-containing protein [Bacteroidales bacterium]
MAVIGKIRGYSGLLIAIIGLGLAAFVLQDFLGNKSPQRQSMEVGRVNKNDISFNEFENLYQETLDMYKRQRGVENVEQHEAHMLRQQTWDRIITDHVLKDELEKLGITVSPRELKDMFFGEDPHPLIKSAFNPDPATGEVNRSEMINILQSLDPYDPRLVRLEEEALKQRKKEKYISMIKNGYYIPEFFAGLNYKVNNATADIQYVVERYKNIPDSIFTVGEDDMQTAYNEIKYQYEQEEMRDIEYVVFPVFASDSDREDIYNNVLELKDELENTDKDNIETFVNAVSDKRFDPTYKSKGELAPEIDSIMFDSPVGTTYGPYMHNDEFILSKLVDVEFRPDSMSAEHVLIAYQGAMRADQQITRTYSEAEEKADSIYDVLTKRQATLSNIAAEVSDDASAAHNQGDLGWFQDGQMVPSFNQAVIDNPVGSFVVAESDFGFHVIKVTGKASPVKKVQVANVAREIVPSDATYNRTYSQASEFAVKVRDNEDFSATAEEMDLTVRPANRLKKMDNNIPGIQNPREVVRWAFSEDVSVGSTSRIFEIDDKFIIANLKNIREEGYAKMDEIEDQVREHALKQKKFEQISQQINNMEGQSLSQIAEQLDLTVSDLLDVKMSTPSIAGIGNEPVVIGRAFNVEVNKVSKPINGTAGVFVIEVNRRDEDVKPSDYNVVKSRLQQEFENQAERIILEALKENAKIEDHREWFF